MSKLHYIHAHHRAIEAGFVHFAAAIAVLYFAEWGEVMPAAPVRNQNLGDV